MRPFLPKAGWMLAGVLALYVLSALAGVVSGGDLDPPGLPGSTMKSLADVPPSWHRILPADDGDIDGCNSTRFTCVMGGAALLDNETGLVWAKNPSVGTLHQLWGDAFFACLTAVIGGRQAWRLPTIDEMLTLRDDSADHVPDGAPPLPANQRFWTSSQDYYDPTLVHVFVLNGSFWYGLSKDQSPGPGFPVWCVRGAQSSSYPGPP